MPGVEEAPKYVVGTPVEVEKLSEGGTLAARGFKVRLENQRVVRTGRWTKFYADGNISAVGFYENDHREGDCTQYYHSGSKMREGVYVVDKKVGPWTYYKDDLPSTINRIEIFGSRGTLTHYTEFYEGLNVRKLESETVDERQAGVVVRYDTNGDCWVIEDRDGSLTEWEMYLPDGSIFAQLRNGQYRLQSSIRRNISQDNAFRDAKSRITPCGGVTRVLE